MKSVLSIIFLLLGLYSEGCYSQQSFTQEPAYTEVNPEADTELICLVQNIGGECRWQKDGKPLGLYDGKYEWSGDPRTGDCSIIIKNVNIIFDDGVWECQVTSSSFESQDALASSPAKLVIREPPKTYNILQNKNIIDDGSKVTLVDSKEESVSCQSRESNPAPFIRWFLGDDQEITEFSVQNNQTESEDSRRWQSMSVLQYRFRRNDAERQLTCRIYHPAIVNGYYDSSVDLDILYKPEVSVRQSSQGLIEEGASAVTLSCSSDANPPGRVFWKKAGDSGDPTYAENLNFDPINRKDSGAYICQSENHIGLSDEAIIELNVLYPPKILQMNPSEGITVGVHNRSVLSCTAEGNPEPKYQWLQKLPATNQVIKRGYEESLIIDDTTYDHQGEYVCEAISFIGNQKKVAQSEPIRMEVRGAPQVLRYSVAKEVEAISGRDVRLEMEVCSDPVPSRTTWDWGSLRVEAGKALHDRYMAEEMIEHPSRDDCYIARLLVKSVNPTDSRRYFLDVENVHGTDRYAVALTVKDPVSMASVIGVVIALLVVFVILVIILLYAYKSHKMCFKACSNPSSSSLNKPIISGAKNSVSPEAQP
ncbi:synaptogenesis protein syg-1 isoform X2 [Lepeophtheirus salmonis]|uniref:synaptogenesis protein syg-1 isoform X2 n=1 Tax=Lepeophtheirus salmonis TaxID=72036 RepID=UPI003AF36BB0